MKGMYGVETTHPATVIIVVDTLKILPDLAIEGDGPGRNRGYGTAIQARLCPLPN
jgi:hypothetical protein